MNDFLRTIIIREMELPSPESNSVDGTPRARSPLLNRRELIRAALLASAASGLAPQIAFAQAIESGLTPAARGEDGSKFLTDPNWKALFLNDHQNQTLIALSDVIIPATDTPGAKVALANRFIDLLLSVEPAETQRQFVDALAFIDQESQKQFGKDFISLAADDQVWLLTQWAYPPGDDSWIEEEAKADPAQQHFRLLKWQIASAYYGSEIGMKELGWDGEFTHGPFGGCDHQGETHT